MADTPRHVSSHPSDSSESVTGSNRLAGENSPYLLQHAHNPVDWYPWGAEVFAKAREEDKPVFLSIGYSTCHWCHVMAHESFEDDGVAALLNKVFVNIKVDREERPDLDGVYMTACQLFTGHGGWPLTIVMTPDMKPFFAGTYIPKESDLGRVGLKEMIPRISQLWHIQRDDVEASADSVLEKLQVLAASGEGNPKAGEVLFGSDRLSCEPVQKGLSALAERFDNAHGGFSPAPKFPTPHILLFLTEHALRTGSTASTHMVATTLNHMRSGGMFDHVGFGFHRYATDREWLLPHFEKMLYDQAMLAWAYIDGWNLTGDPLHRQTAEEIFTYVLRDMQSPQGMFYAAEDADTPTDTGEQEEGWFYTFTADEIRQLPADVVDIAHAVYGVQEEGNFAEEATGKRTGRNILHYPKILLQLAEELDLPESVLKIRVEDVRANLYAMREKRSRPHRDDKLLADWNGLFIGALARGGRMFDAPQYVEDGLRAAEDLLCRLYEGGEEGARISGSGADSELQCAGGPALMPGGRLLHCRGTRDAGITGLLTDYAFFIHGCLELYEAMVHFGYAGAERWLDVAVELQAGQERHFAADGGSYYTAPADAGDVLVRMMEAYDAALPSGVAVSLYNLQRLSTYTEDGQYARRATALLGAHAHELTEHPAGYTMWLFSLLSGQRQDG